MEDTLKILIIEDSEDDALLVLSQIRKGGYNFYYERVDTAEDMRSALSKKKWDIVLSDYAMPHFNGLKALTLLKELGIDLPFIIISGTIGEEVAVECMKFGAHDYIMKDNLKRLLPAIERELRESESRAERKLLELKKKEAEEALRESEKRYRRITEGLTDYLYSVRVENGQAAEATQGAACEAVTGYTTEEFSKDPFLWFRMVVPEDQDKVKEQIRLVLSGVDVKPLEHRIQCKDGTIKWVSDTTILIKDASGKLLSYDGVIKDITERKEADRRLLNAIITTEETERNRFSQELHDGLGPILSTVKLYFQWLAETTDSERRASITKIGIQNIDDAIQALREISNKLSPRVLSSMGLVPALKNLIYTLNETQKIKINISCDTERRYDSQIEITLYRIISELINNTLKYAKAQIITIDIAHHAVNKKMLISFSDDGIGFNLEEALKNKKGMGLYNIRQRIETLNGTISFDTEIGKPLMVRLELPFN
jgi:PAS domain S-box-containing protein